MRASLCSIGAALVLGLSTAASAQIPTWQITEELLGDVNPKTKPYTPVFGRPPVPVHRVWGYFFAPGGRTAVHVYGEGGKAHVLIDGVERGVYDEVNDVLVSPDGRHVALLTTRRNDGKKVPVPVLDGTELGTPSNQLLDLTPEGKLFHLLQSGKSSALFENAAEKLRFEAVPEKIVFRAGHLAARVWGFMNLRWIVDGESGPKCNPIGMITFSRDGRRHAYLCAAGTGDNRAGGNLLVVDGKPLQVLDSIARKAMEGKAGKLAIDYGGEPPTFSPDGGRLAYTVILGAKQQVVAINDRFGPVFERIQSSVAFSEDGQHFGYIAVSGKTTHAVVDHKTVHDYLIDRDSADEVLLSPDGSRIAFSTRRTPYSRTDWRLVADGKASEPRNCEGIAELQFSRAGRHLAYVARACRPGSTRKEASFVVIDGAPVKEYQEIVASTLEFQDEGTVAFVAREGLKFFRTTVRLGGVASTTGR